MASQHPVLDLFLKSCGQRIQMPKLFRKAGFCVHADRLCWYVSFGKARFGVDLGTHMIATARFLNYTFKKAYDDDLTVDHVSYDTGACALYSQTTVGNPAGQSPYEPFLLNLNNPSSLLDLAEAMLVYMEGLNDLDMRCDHLADP